MSESIKKEGTGGQVVIANLEEILLSSIQENLPYAKILIIATPTAYFNKGVALKEKLERIGNRVISIIVEEDFSLSLESVCGIFNASEEIRGVVAIGSKVFGAAEYFSAIKSVEGYLVDYDFPQRLNLNDLIYIKNKNSIDKVYTTSKKILIIDKDCINRNNFYENVLSYLAEKATKAIDCYINSAFIDKADLNPLRHVLTAISKILILSQSISSENKLEIIKECIRLEKFFSNSKWREFLSAVSITEFLTSVKEHLSLSFKILEYYLAASRQSTFLYKIPDYRERLEKLTWLFEFDERSLLNGYITQSKLVRAKIHTEKEVFNRISCDLEFIYKTFNALKERFLSEYIIDTNIDRVENTIVYSGDTPTSFNGMSVLREFCFEV